MASRGSKFAMPRDEKNIRNLAVIWTVVVHLESLGVISMMTLAVMMAVEKFLFSSSYMVCALYPMQVKVVMNLIAFRKIVLWTAYSFLRENALAEISSLFRSFKRKETAQDEFSKPALRAAFITYRSHLLATALICTNYFMDYKTANDLTFYAFLCVVALSSDFHWLVLICGLVLAQCHEQRYDFDQANMICIETIYCVYLTLVMYWKKNNKFLHMSEETRKIDKVIGGRLGCDPNKQKAAFVHFLNEWLEEYDVVA